LAHQNSGGRVLGEEVGCRCRDDRDAETPEHVVASELDGKVTGKPIGRLHDDGLCAIRCQALQHLAKAGSLIDGIGTAHGCIVILFHDGEACSLGERLNGCSLTLIAVLVSTNTGRAATKSSDQQFTKRQARKRT
jgi:hypothetical protein